MCVCECVCMCVRVHVCACEGDFLALPTLLGDLKVEFLLLHLTLLSSGHSGKREYHKIAQGMRLCLPKLALSVSARMQPRTCLMRRNAIHATINLAATPRLVLPL